MKILLEAAALAYLLFIFYLAYCAIWEARRLGRLAAAPLAVKAIVYSILAVGVVLDAAFNVTVGSALFLEPPNLRRPLFTARCKAHLEDEGWRGRIARFVCDGWLNPFQPGHC